MPVHRNPAAAVLIWQDCLSNAKRSMAIVDDNTNSEISSRIKELFKFLEDGLEYMKSILPSVQGWEESIIKEFTELVSMIQEFGELVREMRDGVYENRDSSEEMQNRPSISESNLRSSEEKIRTIKDQLSVIDLKTKVLLHRKTDKLPAVKDQAKKAASEYWQKHCMEEYILTSSTITSLTLSYEVLEQRLKLCLLCFSIFTDNTVIKKRPLIYWWIGEGFVTAKDNNTAEEEGEHVFQELIRKGMIKPHNKNLSPSVSSCTMHPWMRRMLISAANKAEFFDFDMTKATPPTSFSSSGRACLVSKDYKGGSGTSQQKEVEKEILKPEDLQTLFNVNEQYVKLDRQWLSNARSMIVLHLGRWQKSTTHHIEVVDDEFMKGLETQKHLKYFSLGGISRIMELPDSIAKLENLRILDLLACHNLGRLPSCIGSLKKLTHLDVSECYLLESMPKELEKLSGLQVLKGFVVHSSSDKDGCDLRKLAEWPKLRKLSICMGSAVENQEDEQSNLSDSKDAKELSKLSDFKALRILTISWGGRSIEFQRASRQLSKKESMTKKSSPSIPPSHQKLSKKESMTKKSSPSIPPSLQKLDLRCFPRTVAPDWLRASNLSTLEKLYIRGGKLGSFPQDQGVWNVVTTLRLKHLKGMQIQWKDVESAFPNLTYFEKVKCEGFHCDDCCAEMRDDGVYRKEGADGRWTKGAPTTIM